MKYKFLTQSQDMGYNFVNIDEKYTSGYLMESKVV